MTEIASPVQAATAESAWPATRSHQLYKLQALLDDLLLCNHGSGFIERLERCIQKAEALTTADARNAEDDFPGFLLGLAAQRTLEGAWQAVWPGDRRSELSILTKLLNNLSGCENGSGGLAKIKQCITWAHELLKDTPDRPSFWSFLHTQYTQASQPPASASSEAQAA